MRSLPFKSFLHSVLIFIIFIFPISLCDEDERYSNCARTFDCGNIQGVGYPFWGNSWPDYCGHPAFRLDCGDDRTTTTVISSKRFRVLGIDREDRILNVARMDFFFDGICLKQFDNTTIDFTLFELSPNTLYLTLFYGCLFLPISIPPQFTLLAQVCCSVNGSNGPNQVFFSIGQVKANEVIVGGGCKTNIVVPILQTASQAIQSNQLSLSEVINQGSRCSRL